MQKAKESPQIVLLSIESRLLKDKNKEGNILRSLFCLFFAHDCTSNFHAILINVFR